MAFRPNYGMQRADRNRAVQARREEKAKARGKIRETQSRANCRH
jgi:hypothetical protein